MRSYNVYFAAPETNTGGGKVLQSKAKSEELPADLDLDKEQIVQVRETFKAAKDRDTTLTDVEICRVVGELEADTNGEIPGDTLVEALEDAEPGDEIAPIDARNIEALAAREAAILDKSPEVQSETNTVLDANEKMKQSSLDFLFVLRDVRGTDVLDKWPIPGTSKGGKGEKNCGNRIPDKYSHKIGTETRSSSFYEDLVAQTTEGKKLADTLAEIKKASGKEKTGAYANLKYRALAQLKNRANGRWNAWLKLYRDAMRIHFQEAAINDLPYVQVVYATEKVTVTVGGKEVERVRPVRGPRPIWLQHPELNKHPDDQDNVTVGQFLRYKVSIAKEKGGTIEALNESVKRAGETPTVPKIDMKLDTSVNVVSDVYKYLDGDGWEAEKKACRPDQAGADERLLAWWMLSEKIDALTAPYKKRARELEEAMNNKMGSKAAA